MENFIFILIAIIIFGYKQYQKSLKKKNDNLVKPSPKNSTNPSGINIGNIDEGLNDFMNNFLGKQEAEVVSDTISDDDFNEISSNFNTYEDGVDIVDNKEDKPYSIEDDDSINLKNRYNKQFGINQNKEDVITEELDFDLRKAVVYDAVLNAPYIQN